MRALIRVLAATAVLPLLLGSAGCARRAVSLPAAPPSAEVTAAPRPASETVPATASTTPPQAPPTAPRPQPEPKSPEAGEESMLRGSAAAVALEAAKGAGGAKLGRLSVGPVRLARDDEGTWWASVLVTPSKPGVDPLPVFLKRTDGKWRVFDLGTGVMPDVDERFPAEVRQKL